MGNDFDSFNERDAARRIVAIRELYAEDAVLYEPDASAKGHAAISEAVTALLAHLPPNFVFSAAGSAIVGLWLANRHALGQGGGHALFPIGCLLLLSLQFTGLRHANT